MNPREVILRVLADYELHPGDVDRLLDALCPPGSRVVVSRESKPCETCHGMGRLARPCPPGIRSGSLVGRDVQPCEQCDGSGVVEATTIHGLAEATDEDVAFYKSTVINRRTNEPAYLLVALPEDGE